MRFALAAFGLAAIATAHDMADSYSDKPVKPVAPVPYAPPKNETTKTAVYVTEVMTAYTTYCPQPTTFTHGPSTYTITSATTITLPCPGGCTVSKPVYSSTSAPVVPPAPVETPVSPVMPPKYPSANSTMSVHPPPTGTGAYTPPASTSPISPGYTGAANKASFGIAGILAAAGLVAAL